MKHLVLGLAALALAGPALAQGVTSQKPLGNNPSIGALLNEGYEIKAAFVNNGLSYVFLQKQTSAYMCKSGAGAACEKLN